MAGGVVVKGSDGQVLNGFLLECRDVDFPYPAAGVDSL